MGQFSTRINVFHNFLFLSLIIQVINSNFSRQFNGCTRLCVLCISIVYSGTQRTKYEEVFMLSLEIWLLSILLKSSIKAAEPYIEWVPELKIVN